MSKFDVFDNIINGSDVKAKLKWAQRFRRAILEENDPKTGKNIYQDGYYPLLMEEYHYVNSRNYEFEHRTGHHYYCNAKYYESNKHCIAQVATYPREITSVEGDELTTKEKGEISIATYCVNDKDEVVIVNRFDAVGFQYHDNDYSIYGSLANTYQRYFTDGYYSFAVPGGGFVSKPYAKLPHFHFQSPDQTASMGQEKCNAISVDNLLNYLDVLQEGTDPTIQTESLGMPFLDYFKNERTYHSHMLSFLERARDALIEQGDSCDIPIITYMEHMIDLYQGYDDGGDTKKVEESFTTKLPTQFITTTTSFPSYNIFDVGGYPSFVPTVGTPEGFENIKAIQQDLSAMNGFIKIAESRPELIAGMADTFMTSLNAPIKNNNEEEQTIVL